MYSDDDHFLYELVQNAQDNDYKTEVVPKLSLILLNDDPTGTDKSVGCLWVKNNEVGFFEEQIKAITSVGASDPFE